MNIANQIQQTMQHGQFINTIFWNIYVQKDTLKHSKYSNFI